ncbi:MAG: CDP-alcohol phosphatidyltransferase family protein [Prevotellaceae bacterium]|nr:CDP-alcohol phosphatidyltransferase family protein [Prevotellaceae bacterium]
MANNETFRSLLQASFKSNDTEEWLDIWFTRPIGLVFTLVGRRWGIHPNSITIFSIFLGVGAGVMFAFADFLSNLCGVVLLMMANFCDSADGQLARLTGQKSMKGRCLDGFAGDTWFVSIYLAIAFRLWSEPLPFIHQSWGVGGLLLVAIAGLFCHAPQSSLSDYYRQIHLFFLKGKEGSELDSYEAEKAIVASLRGKKDVFWDKAFHANYMKYCRSQERRTPAFQLFHATLKQRYGTIDNVPETLKKSFVKGSRPLMPLTNFLTFNSRAILVYLSCLSGYVWIFPLAEIVVYQLIYRYMRYAHERLCKELTSSINP